MGSALTDPSGLSASESETKVESESGASVKKQQRKETEFAWRDGPISRDCTWTEFQKATSGSNRNKAAAYYEYTGRTKEFNARKEYMGATPSKASYTGRMVIGKAYEESRKNGDRAFDFGGNEVFENYLKSGDYKTQPFPKLFLKNVKYNGKHLKNYDMGHLEDAVTKWNDFFRNLGEEGKELARKWMKLPEIYKLQFFSENRSDGSKLGHTKEGRYQNPEIDKQKIKEFREIHSKEIEEIEKKYNEYSKRKGTGNGK